MLDAALHYAHLRRPIIPLHYIGGGECSCRSPKCDRPMRHPITRRGIDAATTDEAQIRAWWRAHPRANIGLLTGHGLFALDRDDRKGGRETLAALERQHGRLPRTVTSKTPGGRHLLFSCTGPDLPSTVGSLGPGLDTRCARGYIVAPPSIRADGRYEWIHEPGRVELAPLPEWIVEALAAANVRGSARHVRFIGTSSSSSHRAGASSPHGHAAHEPHTGAATPARGGHDLSPSGLDAQRAIQLVQRGATYDEIAAALSRSAGRKRDPEDYIDRTIAHARAWHERGLTRARVYRAFLDHRPAIPGFPGMPGMPEMNRVMLHLVPQGRHAYVEWPLYYDTPAHRALGSPRDPQAVRALVGRHVEVAREGGERRWITLVPMSPEAP
jgi:hypothetical protein